MTDIRIKTCLHSESILRYCPVCGSDMTDSDQLNDSNTIWRHCGFHISIWFDTECLKLDDIESVFGSEKTFSLKTFYEKMTLDDDCYTEMEFD